MREITLQTPPSEAKGIKKYFNPFPGLRPFRIDESHLFFGREGQCEEIMTALAAKRFVAVTGASGSGKSSLIYCGLVPILHGGFITEAGSIWKVISFRPGTDPINNLTKTIAHNLYKEENSEVNETVTEIMLRRSSLGLIEAIKQSNLKSGENILLLVDQFEELFRFKRDQKDFSSINESEAFVRLLVEAVRQREVPIYIVLTMRSDFVGDCAQFQDLTKLINESNYLIPQMTRDDFRRAIIGPIAVSGAKIDPQLVDQLLNEVGNNPDQLPIFQHALMRTWDYWQFKKDLNKPITLSDYEAIGKMLKALSEHANELYFELSDEGKRICESMFKTLTEKGSDNRGIRRPTKVEEIAEIAWVLVDQVIEIIEKFRAPGRSFLTPSVETPINKDTIIDISHESLMRIWNKLRLWVDEEAASVRMYRRLADLAATYQATKTGLLKPPELTLALEWEKKQQPVFTWAKRYNRTLERTKVFLRNSEKEYEAEEQLKIQLQIKKLQRTRMIAVLFAAAAIVALLLVLYIQSLRVDAEKAKNMAEAQKKIADKQRLIAQNKSKEAEEQKNIALKQKSIADELSKIAEVQKIVAIKNADDANYIAINKTKESQEQRILAENSAQKALLQEQEALKAKEEVYNKHMLSIAKSLTIKSLEINDDKDLKALLAYQAYLFNLNYGGNANDADIYLGLYSAMNVLNKKLYNVYMGHADAVNSLAFIPNSNIMFSAGSDGKIFKWDLVDNTKTPYQVIDNNTINKTLAISNNGKWLVCGTSGSGIVAFNLKLSPLSPKSYKSSPTNISALTFMPDNIHFVLASEDNKISMWNIEDGDHIEIATLNSLVLSLSVSPDGNTIAAGTKDGKILLLNAENYSQEILYDEPRNPVHAVAFSHNGKILASGDIKGNLKYWNINKRTLITSLHGHSARITDIKFSPNDEILASASFDATVQLWLTNDFNTLPIRLKDHESWVLSVAFNPAGDKIILGSLKENRLIAIPSKAKYMADVICGKIKRNMTQNEWSIYVGKDIPYEKTCQK